MKEFLLLFRGGNDSMAAQSPEQAQAHMQRWRDWMTKLGKEGKFVGAQPLNKAGKTVAGQNKVVSDGPFMEGKELVGGYLICKADTIDEAVAISKGCPLLEFADGVVEVRKIEELSM